MELKAQTKGCLLYLAPGKMVFHTVDGKGNQLHIPLGKLWGQLHSSAKLSGTHWGEVSGVGEENAPSERQEKEVIGE